jgi:DNA-binding MarR family transcriptional regulator
MLTEKGSMAAMPDRTDLRSPPPSAGRNLLFLREEELRLAQDLLYFGYRDFTAGADRILDGLAMGRAHHRVLHFVGRAPGIKVGELLAILCHHQAEPGPRAAADDRGRLVRQAPGLKDKRQRLLHLTPQGEALERQLFAAQREWVLRAYREAGPQAVEGFRQVMRGLMAPRPARSSMPWSAPRTAPSPPSCGAPEHGRLPVRRGGRHPRRG